MSLVGSSAAPLGRLPVCRVVITGGPCSGKTTSAKSIKAALEKRGYRVLLVPEAATLLHAMGADLVLKDATRIAVLQRAILRLVVTLEDQMLQFAVQDIAAACELGESTRQIPTGVVLLCDRGVLDGSAYCDPSIWAQVMASAFGSDERAAALAAVARYELVVHLVSVAVDAPQHYHRDNNAARSESINQACALDATTQRVWEPARRAGKWRCVGNDGLTFEQKIARTVGLVLEAARTSRVTVSDVVPNAVGTSRPMPKL